MGRTRNVDVSDDPHLTDKIWNKIGHLIPETEASECGGRPPHSTRACLAGVLFVLITGCQWQKLPKNYPSASTCWRRFDEWTSCGVFEFIWSELLSELDGLGKIDWKEAAADAWFARAKKGAIAWETPSAARGLKSWTSSTDMGLRSPFMSRPPQKVK